MITLLLLHPLKQTPVQVWPFSDQAVIRLGRSTDNDVVLYSAVVSRHHVELCYTDNHWEVINLGTNGTYVDGKRITKTPVTDGAIIRLARSGPNIQIKLGEEVLSTVPRNLLSRREGRVPVSGRTSQNSDENAEPSPGATNIPKSPEQSNCQEPSPLRATGRLPQLQEQRRLVPPLPSRHLKFKVPSAPIAPGQSSSAARSTTGLSSDRQSAGRAHHDSAWQTIHGHHIRHILGQGDIGITYLAEISGKSVVLKTLNASWVGNETASAALDLEADLLSHVQHPRIPQVLDRFHVDQQPYLVMEHIEGDSLVQYIGTHGAVSLRQAIAWMVDLCRVLSHLHRFNPPVVHRNIEPANLIRRPTGELSLIGFGSIKALALERLKAVGAAGFVAPHQLKSGAGPQVDLYPIAATLVYLISGHNPLRFCERDQNRYRLNPSAIPDIPASLQQVLSRLVQGEYPSASDVASALMKAT